MSNTTTAYDHLLLEMRPRPIRSQSAYRRVLGHVERLMGKPELSRPESEMVELLSTLIEQYEAVEYPTPDCSPAEMLEHLLEVRALSKAQLARDAGIPRSVITNVLAGRRAISKATAVKLARYFRVPLHLFVEGV
jgi:HTH-type transcriptional regulator/antitoxin HigA